MDVLKGKVQEYWAHLLGAIKLSGMMVEELYIDIHILHPQVVMKERALGTHGT